jgi:hypothetical protein
MDLKRKLESIEKRISVLQKTLFLATCALDDFVKNENYEDEIDTVFYEKEAIIGVEEFLSDINSDVLSMLHELEEEDSDIPDSI